PPSWLPPRMAAPSPSQLTRDLVRPRRARRRPPADRSLRAGCPHPPPPRMARPAPPAGGLVLGRDDDRDRPARPARPPRRADADRAHGAAHPRGGPGSAVPPCGRADAGPRLHPPAAAARLACPPAHPPRGLPLPPP